MLRVIEYPARSNHWISFEEWLRIQQTGKVSQNARMPAGQKEFYDFSNRIPTSAKLDYDFSY
jgi:hypothetical protein